jgi:hypothetical protein
MNALETLSFLADLANSIGGRIIIERSYLAKVKVRIECDVREAGKLKAIKQRDFFIGDSDLRLGKQAKFDYGENMLLMFKRRVAEDFKAEIHAVSGNPEATIS